MNHQGLALLLVTLLASCAAEDDGLDPIGTAVLVFEWADRDEDADGEVEAPVGEVGCVEWEGGSGRLTTIDLEASGEGLGSVTIEHDSAFIDIRIATALWGDDDAGGGPGSTMSRTDDCDVQGLGTLEGDFRCDWKDEGIKYVAEGVWSCPEWGIRGSSGYDGGCSACSSTGSPTTGWFLVLLAAGWVRRR